MTLDVFGLFFNPPPSFLNIFLVSYKKTCIPNRNYNQNLFFNKHRGLRNCLIEWKNVLQTKRKIFLPIYQNFPLKNLLLFVKEIALSIKKILSSSPSLQKRMGCLLFSFFLTKLTYSAEAQDEQIYIFQLC